MPTPVQAPVYPQGIYVPPPAQQVNIQPVIRYGKDPLTMRCQYCEEQIQTSTKSKPGAIGKRLLQ